MAKKHEAPAVAAPENEAVEQNVGEGLVTQRASTALEVQDEPSLADMLAEDAGAGLQNMGANDFAIPFLSILQKGSPQVSRANAKYIKGAEPGMIMNTISQEIYSGEDGILFIPCGYNKSIVEWTSRDSGGGLVAHHKEGDPIIKRCTRNERGQLIVPESGNILVDTAYHYGLLLKAEGFPEWVVISMFSTQLKQSRNWNTSMRAIMQRGPRGIFNPPTYSRTYRLTTIGQTKDSYDWFGWKIMIESEVSDVETYKMAREFSRQIEAGQVRISAPPSDFDESAAPGEGIPF